MNAHRYLEEQDPKSKEALRKKTEEKLGFSLSENPASEKAPVSSGRIFTYVAAAVCAVCLLIALPFILQNTAEPQPSDRYHYVDEYTYYVSDCTIGDYNKKNGTDLLYLDKYGNAEDVLTWIYVNTEDENDIVCFYEYILEQDTFLETELYIVERYTVVDIMENLEEGCENTAVLNGMEVCWQKMQTGLSFITVATFEYKSYKYAIKFNYATELDHILQVIESML